MEFSVIDNRLQNDHDNHNYHKTNPYIKYTHVSGSMAFISDLITIMITPVVCEFTKSYVWFSKLNKIDETQVTETFII